MDENRVCSDVPGDIHYERFKSGGFSTGLPRRTDQSGASTPKRLSGARLIGIVMAGSLPLGDFRPLECGYALRDNQNIKPHTLVEWLAT